MFCSLWNKNVTFINCFILLTVTSIFTYSILQKIPLQKNIRKLFYPVSYSTLIHKYTDGSYFYVVSYSMYSVLSCSSLSRIGACNIYTTNGYTIITVLPNCYIEDYTSYLPSFTQMRQPFRNQFYYLFRTFRIHPITITVENCISYPVNFFSLDFNIPEPIFPLSRAFTVSI